MATCNAGGSLGGGSAAMRAGGSTVVASSSRGSSIESRLSERDQMINDEIKSINLPKPVTDMISPRNITSTVSSMGFKRVYDETLSQSDIGKIFVTTSYKGEARDPDSVSFHKTMLTGFAKGSNKPIFTDISTGESVGYQPERTYNMIFR